jgi:hypothetical protein
VEDFGEQREQRAEAREQREIERSVSMKPQRGVNWDMVFHAFSVSLTLVAMVVSVALWVRSNDMNVLNSSIAREAKIALERDEMMRSERTIQVNYLDERLKRIEMNQETILELLSQRGAK